MDDADRSSAADFAELASADADDLDAFAEVVERIRATDRVVPFDAEAIWSRVSGSIEEESSG